MKNSLEKLSRLISFKTDDLVLFIIYLNNFPKMTYIALIVIIITESFYDIFQGFKMAVLLESGRIRIAVSADLKNRTNPLSSANQPGKIYSFISLTF